MTIKTVGELRAICERNGIEKHDDFFEWLSAVGEKLVEMEERIKQLEKQYTDQIFISDSISDARDLCVARAERAEAHNLQLERIVEAARTYIEKHGKHTEECYEGMFFDPEKQRWAGDRQLKPCVCGLDAALNALTTEGGATREA